MKIPFLTNYIDKRINEALLEVGLADKKEYIGLFGMETEYFRRTLEYTLREQFRDKLNRYEFQQLLIGLGYEYYLIHEKEGYRKAKKK